MSAVRLCKIKLRDSWNASGSAIFGKASIYFRSGIIYLPLPREEKVLRIDTESDKLLEPVVKTGWVSSVMVCQDRDLIFTLSSDEKEVKTFKATGEDVRFSLDIGLYPEEAAFDSDRDMLVIRGTKEPPPNPEKVIDLYRFPECKHLGSIPVEGEPVSVKYDELEDKFILLSRRPSELIILDPSQEMGREFSGPIQDSEPVCMEICPSKKRIAIGTSSGKIILFQGESPIASEITAFREPVYLLVYNPLLDHLYVAFENSRNLTVLDMETMKVRENIRCSSEVSDIVFDQMHNKFYVLMEKTQSIEVYLDQGR